MPGEENKPVAVVLEDSIPAPKRYGHFGKRRRSYTDELFRCPIIDKISRTDLVCNHLLWRNNLAELRDHLAQHLNLEQVSKLTDSQVREHFTDARRIFLQPIPEDGPSEDQEDDVDVEDEDEAADQDDSD